MNRIRYLLKRGGSRINQRFWKTVKLEKRARRSFVTFSPSSADLLLCVRPHSSRSEQSKRYVDSTCLPSAQHSGPDDHWSERESDLNSIRRVSTKFSINQREDRMSRGPGAFSEPDKSKSSSTPEAMKIEVTAFSSSYDASKPVDESLFVGRIRQELELATSAET